MTEQKKETGIVKTEVVEAESMPITVVDSSPKSMLEMALNGNMDLDKLEKFIALQERHDRNEARKAYYQAVARFKKDPPVIVKDKTNKHANNSLYSSIGNFLNTVNPALGKFGLSVSFNTNQETEGFLAITAIMAHEQGHSEECTMSICIETTGAKGAAMMTRTHATMSALTYGMKATYSAITGLAAIDPKFDDDGNMAGGIFINTDQAIEIKDLMKEVKVNEKAFLGYLKSESVNKIIAKDYSKAISFLNMKKGGAK